VAEAILQALSGHVARADVGGLQSWADTARGLRSATVRSLSGRR
jgi:hypothetical protein